MNEIKINVNDITFDNKTREMCKSCKRYGSKATCPPHVESVEYYEKLFRSFKNIVLYYENFTIQDIKEWKTYGKESSLAMHNYLLDKRDELFNNGHYLVCIFGAGSCKLCEKCQFPCIKPNLSVIPLEATGVDIVDLMKKHSIEVKFPVQDNFYRIGVVLYD